MTSQGLDSWLPVLRWKSLPNFGPCHNIKDISEFERNYLSTTENRRFMKDLFSVLLSSGSETNNVCLMGPPGCGKTTFIRALLIASSYNKIREKYHFYIFYVNRLINMQDSEIENLFMVEVFNAWSSFFKASNLGGFVQRLSERRIEVRAKINEYMKYYKDNKSKFDKKMIFILEDADSLSDDEVARIVNLTHRHIAISDVKKWLVIRDETYDQYKVNAKYAVNAYFPDRRSLPRVGLYEVLDHRIKGISSEDQHLNPFSENLCSLAVERFVRGNLRSGLEISKRLLEMNGPGQLASSTDVSFIRNYLDKTAIVTLVKDHGLPNLFDPKFQSVPFPIALDIILAIRHVRNKPLIMNVVDQAVQIRSAGAGLTAGRGNDLVKIPTSAFDHSLNALIDEGLIRRFSADSYMLNDIGDMLCDHARQKTYIDTCISCLGPRANKSDIIWSMVGVRVDTLELAMNALIQRTEI
jgi:energy-coupling factor transporter ATP-binding protein EcfA2